jgi:hypothetical protein
MRVLTAISRVRVRARVRALLTGGKAEEKIGRARARVELLRVRLRCRVPRIVVSTGRPLQIVYFVERAQLQVVVGLLLFDADSLFRNFCKDRNFRVHFSATH